MAVRGASLYVAWAGGAVEEATFHVLLVRRTAGSIALAVALAVFVGPKPFKATLAAVEVRYHAVYFGETLWVIADRSGTTVEALARTNGIENPNLIFVGAIRRIPGSSGLGAVVAGRGVSMRAPAAGGGPSGLRATTTLPAATRRSRPYSRLAPRALTPGAHSRSGGNLIGRPLLAI